MQRQVETMSIAIASTTASKRPLIVSLGGINMDLVAFAERLPADGETVVGSRFVTYAGGKGANQAVAAARAGGGRIRAAMAGRVGDDLFGPQLVAALQAAGVATDGVGVAPGVSSGIAVICVGEGGQNRIVQALGANDTCGNAEYDAIAALLPQTAAVLLQLEVSVELSRRVAEQAAAQGVAVILDPGPARPLPADFYRHLSFITPNETEAEALVGYPISVGDTVERAARDLLGRGVGAAVITLGAQGAYWTDGRAGGYSPPFPVAAVDTVAAGDAFNGALAVALTEGKPLPDAVRWASAAGALAVTRVGAQDAMPAREAIEALLAAHPAQYDSVR